jgi:hypothetical protein
MDRPARSGRLAFRGIQSGQSRTRDAGLKYVHVAIGDHSNRDYKQAELERRRIVVT